MPTRPTTTSRRRPAALTSASTCRMAAPGRSGAAIPVTSVRSPLKLSDGQLRMRVRGWEREQAWGPRYVGHELAGTRQAATHHRQTAALRRAEADAISDPRRPTSAPSTGSSGRGPRRNARSSASASCSSSTTPAPSGSLTPPATRATAEKAPGTARRAARRRRRARARRHRRGVAHRAPRRNCRRRAHPRDH